MGGLAPFCRQQCLGAAMSRRIGVSSWNALCVCSHGLAFTALQPPACQPKTEIYSEHLAQRVIHAA